MRQGGLARARLTTTTIPLASEAEYEWPQVKPALRVGAKTSAGKKGHFEQDDPHPDPLPSDGRGNSQIRLSQVPQRLDTPTDGGRFSLSHPMGEGRGEGDSAPKSEVVFARVLRRNCAVEAVERVICRLRISKLNNVPVARS